MIALVIFNRNKNKQNSDTLLHNTKHSNINYLFKKESIHDTLNTNEELIQIGNVNSPILKEGNITSNNGEFSFGKYIFSTKKFIGYRDKIGVKPFFYANTKDLFVYSTSIKTIKKIIETTSINYEYIERVLMGIPPLKHETFYNEIKRLPPAHELIYLNNEIIIQKYWSPKPLINATQDLFNQLLHKAIKIRKMNVAGSELSGGIDSSGISGILAQQQPILHSFSHVMHNSFSKRISPFEDEREFSQKQINFSKNISIHNIDALNKGIINELIQEIKVIGSPFFSSMSLFSEELYDTAKGVGVDVLFSGFGGDELVSSNSSYLINELLQNKELNKVRYITNTNFLTIQNLKYITRAYFPYFIARNTWKKKQLENHLFIKNINIKEILRESTTYKNLNEFLISKIQGNTLLTRLEENGISLRARGIEYTYPLLDVDLIECFLGLPNEIKYNHKLPRLVYRNAIKPYVPKEIYSRDNKTRATVPTVFYRFINDYDKILSILNKYKNGKASKFLNIPKMILQLEIIRKKAIGETINKRIDLRIFIIGLQMILYFDMDVLDDFK